MNNYLQARNDAGNNAEHFNDDVLFGLLDRWENILDDEEQEMLFI